MRNFTVGIVAAAVLVISVSAFSAEVEVSEHFYNGTYDSDWWMITGNEHSAVSFEPSFGILTNGGGLALKISQWQAPVELRATMVGNGDVSLTIASNCWGGFRTTDSGTYLFTPNSSAGPSIWSEGTNYNFRVRYDGTNLELYVGDLGVHSTPLTLPLIGKRIEFSSSNYAKLDSISVSDVPLSPRLTITQSEDNVILMWPTDPPGFTLQSTTDLALTAPWVTVSKVPVVVNGSNVVTEPISGLRQFYRLEQQPASARMHIYSW